MGYLVQEGVWRSRNRKDVTVIYKVLKKNHNIYLHFTVEVVRMMKEAISLVVGQKYRKAFLKIL